MKMIEIEKKINNIYDYHKLIYLSKKNDNQESITIFI